MLTLCNDYLHVIDPLNTCNSFTSTFFFPCGKSTFDSSFCANLTLDQPTFHFHYPLFVPYTLFQLIQQLANKLPRIMIHKWPTSPAPVVGLWLFVCYLLLNLMWEWYYLCCQCFRWYVSRGFTLSYVSRNARLLYFSTKIELDTQFLGMAHMTHTRCRALCLICDYGLM